MNSSKEYTFNWHEAEVLITGGTGTLGKTLTRILIQDYQPKGIRIYSRDEFKQSQMKNSFQQAGLLDEVPVAFILGDIRSQPSLERALKGVDVVFNAAAMKQIPSCESNPLEAIETNVEGSSNILRASLFRGVAVVMHVSTDKAVYPTNLYGMTKAVAERLFIHGNVYSGTGGTKFSCCRYGNVLGSRGSIIPVWQEQAEQGYIDLTDIRMTRFWISVEAVARFIIRASVITDGAEIFIPKMPTMKLLDMANVIGPDALIHEIGLRKGEKLHECLIGAEESNSLQTFDDMYVLAPLEDLNPIYDANGWSYSSDNNPWRLSEDGLRVLL